MTLTAIPTATLDRVLTAQLAVAWAGESGETRCLGWWRTDHASEFGGEDLFRRLLPTTWRWAVLQALREVARRHDERGRLRDHDADRLVSLFHLGFEVDEKLDERLQDLKRAGRDPVEALPGLREIVTTHPARARERTELLARLSPPALFDASDAPDDAAEAERDEDEA